MDKRRGCGTLAVYRKKQPVTKQCLGSQALWLYNNGVVGTPLAFARRVVFTMAFV